MVPPPPSAIPPNLGPGKVTKAVQLSAGWFENPRTDSGIPFEAHSRAAEMHRTGRKKGRTTAKNTKISTSALSESTKAASVANRGFPIGMNNIDQDYLDVLRETGIHVKDPRTETWEDE